MSDPQPLTDADPRAIGPFRLLARLGEGGQGTVYLGEDAGGRRAAVKTLSAQGVTEPSMRQRFVREAEAARTVASFCTAAVVDADFGAAPPYIASEYVEGPALGAAVRADGPIAGGDLDRLAVSIATALVAIHEAGIVHRDLKPDNVLLASGGARVIDFGVAQMPHGTAARTHTSIGTPAFMAPEQIAGEAIGPHSDVFAWGCVVAFAATGRLPFPGGSVAEVLHRVVNGAPDLDGVSERLMGPVAAALDKDPSRRPSSEALLMTLLGRAQAPAASPAAAAADAPTAPEPAGATRVEPPVPPGAAPRKKPVLPWIAAAVAAVVLVAAASYFIAARTGGAPDAGGGEQTGGGEQAGASSSPTPSPTPTGPSSEPMVVPEFTTSYENDWEGMRDSELWEMPIDEGDRSAVLENEDDGDCFYELTLVRGWDDLAEGLEAEVTDSGQGDECTAAPADAAHITLEGGILSVELTRGGAGPEVLRMQPQE